MELIPNAPALWDHPVLTISQLRAAIVTEYALAASLDTQYPKGLNVPLSNVFYPSENPLHGRLLLLRILDTLETHPNYQELFIRP